MPTNSYFIGANAGPRFAEELKNTKEALFNSIPSLRTWWSEIQHQLHVSIANCDGQKTAGPGFPKTTESVAEIQKRNQRLSQKIQAVFDNIPKSIFMIPHDIEISNPSGHILLTFAAPHLITEDAKALQEVHESCMNAISDEQTLSFNPAFCFAGYKPHISIGQVKGQGGNFPTQQEIQAAQLKLNKHKKIILNTFTDLQKIRMLTLYTFDLMYSLPLDKGVKQYEDFRNATGANSLTLATRSIAPRDYGITSVTRDLQNNVQIVCTNSTKTQAFLEFVQQFGILVRHTQGIVTIPITEYDKIIAGKIAGCFNSSALKLAPISVPAPIAPQDL
jgi:hypothetical protein